MIPVMKELDIEQFWKDDGEARMINCFNPGAKQVAFGIRMAFECVFPELGIEGHPWAEYSPEIKAEYAKRYNDKAEKIVGKRLLREEYSASSVHFPYIKRIGEVFEGVYVIRENVEWLEGSTRTAEELERLLDRVEKLDMPSFVFPGNFFRELERIYEQSGEKPDPFRLDGRHIRGPVTLATSLMGVENFLLLYYDAPELVKRFSQVMGDAILRRSRAIDEICGYREHDKPRGFSFADDNCCLTTPELYEDFGYPILKKIFAYYSPDAGDMRYQHSDSEMSHLLPILSRLDFTGVNFGPTVLFDEIRGHMPNTRIDGCIAPFTFMYNNREELFREAKRDCDMSAGKNLRGLNMSTAGSINYGSSLESMRFLMQVIQNYGRY
jgi:uroporphyrinogen decarboxylase